MDMCISPISVVEKMAKKIRDKSDVVCNFQQSGEDVPDPRELWSEKKNQMVFNDLLLEKQNTCESYYVRGRHSNFGCFYLAQKLFQAPTPNNQRECEFHLCVSARTEEP